MSERHDEIVDEIVAVGQLEEALVLAAKLARSARTHEPGEASSPSNDEVFARIEEADSIRLAVRKALENYGCPEEDLDVLTLEIAEVYDACRAYVRKVQRLLASSETDLTSIAVDLASLDAGLVNVEGHLQDLRKLLAKLVVFLARSRGG